MSYLNREEISRFVLKCPITGLSRGEVGIAGYVFLCCELEFPL